MQYAQEGRYEMLISDVNFVNSFIGTGNDKHYKPGEPDSNFELAYEGAKERAISTLKSQIKRIESLTLLDHKKTYRIKID